MTAKKATKIGRPVLPKGEAKDFQIGVRFGGEEARKIKSAISKAGTTTADWARGALIKAAKD